MTWNYRIMKRKETAPTGKTYTYYGLHEVYYGGLDSAGNSLPEDSISWTVDSIIVGDTPEEIVEVLEMMLKDVTEKHPEVLDEEELEAKFKDKNIFTD